MIMLPYIRTFMLLAVFLAGGFFVLPSSADAQTSCHRITGVSNMPATNVYAPPYDVSLNNQLMIQMTCSLSSVNVTVGTGSGQQYVYNRGHVWRPSTGSWATVPLSGTVRQSVWLEGTGSGSFATTGIDLEQPNFFAAHVCTWTGSEWKCGCSDAACATPKWNVQVFSASGLMNPPTSCQENTDGLQLGRRELRPGQNIETIREGVAHAYQFTVPLSVNTIQYTTTQVAAGPGFSGILTISRCPGDFDTESLPNNCSASASVGTMRLYYSGMTGVDDRYPSHACHLQAGETYYFNVRVAPGGGSACPEGGSTECAYNYTN